MKNFVLFTLSIFVSTFLSAQTKEAATADPGAPVLIEKVEAIPGKNIVTYEKWKLSNGLTVIIHEDHSDPIAIVSVSYHVGSARETPGKSGFAHFFEHMMFQGSDNVGDEDHFRIVGKGGGGNNAFTTNDFTFYYETVPNSMVETCLWLEADRMGFLHDAVTKKGFENQRKVVKKEKMQNQINLPYGLMWEIAGQNLYPSVHPYSWPVIGYSDDLDRADESDLKNFFLRWYGPNNAILGITGDVNPKEVLAYAVKYFGSIPAGPEVVKQRVPKVIIPDDKYANSRDDIYQPLTTMTFEGVPIYHRDEAALDLLADIMGSGNNSIFYKNFVKSKRAPIAFVFHQARELSGEFSIHIYAYPVLKDGTQISFNDTEILIRKTLDDFSAEGITDDALLRAKEVTRSAIWDQGESIFEKALMLAQWQMFSRRKRNIQDELDRYARVTKEDLIRVHERYIKGRNALFVNIWPLPEIKTEADMIKRRKWKKESFNPYAAISVELPAEYKGLVYNKSKDSFDRSVQPTQGDQKEAVIPDYYTEKFDNGLQISTTQYKENSKVIILMSMEGGHIVDGNKGSKQGAAFLTAALLNEGTQNFTTEEISAKLERLGSDIGITAGGVQSNIIIISFKENLDATLKILEEKLYRPGFDEEYFDRVKKQVLASIKSQKSSGTITAEKVFNKLIYGKTFLGSHFTGTYNQVHKLKLADLKSYYETYYSPSVTNVIAVGDFDKDEMIAKLGFLKSWKAKAVQMPELSMEELPKYEKTKVFVVHQSDYKSANTTVVIGHISNKFDATGVNFQSTVMNFALGGAFNSRINLNLREDKGFTYGARSGFSGGDYPGAFRAQATVKADQTDSTIVEFMKEINNYVENGITDEELEFTKSNILQRDVLNYETAFQKLGYLNTILHFKLPKDFKEQQAEVVRGLSKADINKLAREEIRPNNMVILVVGNKYLFKEKVDALGYGKFSQLDKTGNPISRATYTVK